MLRYMNISTECISDSIGACHVLSLSRCCIFMPHRSNMYIDVACCYQLSGFLREHTLGLSSSAVICWEELVYVTWVWLVRHTWPISVAGTDLHDSIQDCLRVYLTCDYIPGSLPVYLSGFCATGGVYMYVACRCNDGRSLVSAPLTSGKLVTSVLAVELDARVLRAEQWTRTCVLYWKLDWFFASSVLSRYSSDKFRKSVIRLYVAGFGKIIGPTTSGPDVCMSMV